MRLLATADIHLGSPIRSVALRNPDLGDRLKQASRDTFVQIIDLAVTEKVDALVLTGDIFDNGYPDLRSRAFLIAQLSRLAETGVPTVLIRGNHDALLDHHAHGDLGPNIHLLHKDMPTVEIGDTAFHGLSYDASHIAKSFLPDYPKPVPDKRNVGLMHTSLDGAPGHDPYAPCAAADLMAHGFDLWCLGHIHAPFKRWDGPVLAVMPGIPQPRHFGERQGGTVTLVEMGDGAPIVERRDVSQLGFAELELDLQDCNDQQDVVGSLRDGFLSAQELNQDIAVRLTVTSLRQSAAFVAELAEEIIGDVDRVFLDKITVVPPSRPLNTETDDLVRLMRAEMAEDGFRQAALQQLDEVRSALPSEIAGELDDSALDALFEDAIAEMMLAIHAERPK